MPSDGEGDSNEEDLGLEDGSDDEEDYDNEDDD